MSLKPPVVALLSLAAMLFSLPALAGEPVPAAAMERFEAGVALIEKAQQPQELRDALAAFEEAAELAPLWPDIHFNLARLSAETDKPAKAVKEYRAYLELAPAAADRVAVEAEIARMQEQVAGKRRLGLPGVTFAAMPDGIWVLQMFPGSRVGKTGLKPGYKIVKVEGESVVGKSLDEFFRVIETNAGTGDAMTQATKGRMFSRFDSSRKAAASGQSTVKEEGPVLTLTVRHPVSNTEGPVFITKSMFHSKVLEIEGDEFETEVLSSPLPVLVTFWAGSCGFCGEFVPVIETESARYAGKIKFVNVNVEENGRLARQLGIRGIPTVMVFRGGQQVAMEMGRLPREKLEQLLQSTAAGQ